jgi:hypothetical protein
MGTHIVAWMLQLFFSMYQGEEAKIISTGSAASQLLLALCEMRRAHGGCTLDATSAAKHVAEIGLELKLTILSHRPPAQRDTLTGEQLLAACEGLKERANALLTGGYVAGAMRKYVVA